MQANHSRGLRVYTGEMSNNEQKIIRKAAAGNRMAFRQLVLEHSHAMLRLAWGLTGDESAADDIVQEAFIKAWKKLPEFRMQSSLRSWLHRITVNAAMDHLRRQARHRRHESTDPGWETAEHGSFTPKPDVEMDVRKQAQAAMMNLSETERSALLLRHYEGHSIREIANILGLTTGACKQAVFRAVKKMRIELEPLVTT